MPVWYLASVLAVLLFSRGKALARGPSAGLVATGSVSSPFGPRGAEGVHAGIDVASPAGTEVRAAREGIVADVSPDGTRSGYGNLVIVRHFDNTLSLYAHMDRFGKGIFVGLPVEAGTVLGYVGNTQMPKTKAMRPHLHFEVLKGAVMWQGKIVANSTTPERLDPQPWLRKFGRTVADAHA